MNRTVAIHNQIADQFNGNDNDVLYISGAEIIDPANNSHVTWDFSGENDEPVYLVEVTPAEDDGPYLAALEALGIEGTGTDPITSDLGGPMSDDVEPDKRMTGGELQTVREWLGLTGEALAGILGVNPRTLRAWEAGRDLIPERVRGEVEQIEAATAVAVGELVDALHDARDPAVVVYRTDDGLHAARPETAHLTARWWRHVVARAATEVPGVAIGTRDELDAIA